MRAEPPSTWPEPPAPRSDRATPPSRAAFRYDEEAIEARFTPAPPESPAIVPEPAAASAAEPAPASEAAVAEPLPAGEPALASPAPVDLEAPRPQGTAAPEAPRPQATAAPEAPRPQATAAPEAPHPPATAPVDALPPAITEPTPSSSSLAAEAAATSAEPVAVEPAAAEFVEAEPAAGFIPFARMFAPSPVAPAVQAEPPPVGRAEAPAGAHEQAPPQPEPVPRRVRLTFSRDTLERALVFLEQSDYGGLVTHVFAIRTLVPTAFSGLNGDVPGKLAAQREALHAVVNRLFIKLRMPRYALTAKDLEDRASRSALVELVQALRDARPAEDYGTGDAAVVLEGPIDVAHLTRQLDALLAEPLGSARPWLMLAELLPSRFVTPASGEALNAYRSALIATFTNVAALPSDEFHRVLAGTQNAALDAALRDLRVALRDALEATAARA